jgi:hypothetical protein
LAQLAACFKPLVFFEPRFLVAAQVAKDTQAPLEEFPYEQVIDAISIEVAHERRGVPCHSNVYRLSVSTHLRGWQQLACGGG